MTKLAKVSVVIPCFNHGEFLPEAIASVTAAERDDVELIVVDDGSTDKCTRREMDTLAARGFNVIRQQNKGLAAARNAGILVSKGEYIFPLDADDRVRPIFFDHGIRILDTNPRVGVVYADGQFFGIRTGRWTLGPFDPRRLLPDNFIPCCAVYRRSIWEENGGYDGTMPVQGLEDWDFWLGALEHGWEFAYVPEILFEYRVAHSSMITRAREFTAETQKFISTKHGPLYREAWLQLEAQQKSIRATSRNLALLLKSRLRQKFQRNSNHAKS